MCDTLQLNWKLPQTNKTTQVQSKLNNNNNGIVKKKKTNTSPKKKTGKDSGKYTLRAASIQKRMETEHRKTQPRKRGPKPRPKPQPMSKYRRKTANLRERERMGEINTAFERLRGKIPSPAISGKGRCEKMTKINILHVTIGYIRALENILETGDAGVNVYGTAVVQSPSLPLLFPGETAATTTVQSKKEKVSKPSKKKTSSNIISPTAVTTNIKKEKSDLVKEEFTSCTASPSNSGSEDSGIMDEDCDDYNSYQEDMDQDDDYYSRDCPDWTELTSTLDINSTSSTSDASSSDLSSGSSSSSGQQQYIPSGLSNLSKVLLPPSQPPPSAVPSSRGNMDTLLTSSAISGLLNGLTSLIPIQPENIGLAATTTASLSLNSRSSPSTAAAAATVQHVAAPAAKLRVLQPKYLNRQISFPDLSDDATDLFSDLNSSLDSLEGLGDINFTHEDPFQLMI